jgi:hypothetical protein
MNAKDDVCQVLVFDRSERFGTPAKINIRITGEDVLRHIRGLSESWNSREVVSKLVTFSHSILGSEGVAYLGRLLATSCTDIIRDVIDWERSDDRPEFYGPTAGIRVWGKRELSRLLLFLLERKGKFSSGARLDLQELAEACAAEMFGLDTTKYLIIASV